MKLRILNIISIVFALALIPLNRYHPGVFWWGLGLVVLFQLVILVLGCMSISSGYFLRVLCKAQTTEKVVALSFDDGPHPICTPTILDTLKKYNTEATFFCIGRNIAGNEEVLKRISAEGHLIGNHSYSHEFWFDMYGSKKMLADLRQMDEAVKQVTGLKPVLFRPPYGVTNPNVRKAVYNGKYIPIGWSVRSLDTKINDKQKLLLRVTGKLKAGDIILLHDRMALTAELLPEIIDTIHKKGFKIVRLDKMLNVKAYA